MKGILIKRNVTTELNYCHFEGTLTQKSIFIPQFSLNIYLENNSYRATILNLKNQEYEIIKQIAVPDILVYQALSSALQQQLFENMTNKPYREFLHKVFTIATEPASEPNQLSEEEQIEEALTA